MKLDNEKIQEVIDTMHTLQEYSYVTVPTEDEASISASVDMMCKEALKIDELFDNSY